MLKLLWFVRPASCEDFGAFGSLHVECQMLKHRALPLNVQVSNMRIKCIYIVYRSTLHYSTLDWRFSHSNEVTPVKK